MTIEFDELNVQPDDPIGPRGIGSGNRRRLVAGVAAAMLVAAAGGVGYGIGRGADRDDAGSASAPVPSSESGDAVDGSDTPSTTTAGSSDTADEVPSSTVLLSESDDGFAADRAIGSSGGWGSPAFGSQPMDTLFERSTDSGLTLRVQLGSTYDEFAVEEGVWGQGDWQPAPWCFESGQMRVSLAGTGATGTELIDVGMVGWYAEPFRGRALSWLQLGGNDSMPQWVVVAQVGADVTAVRAVFADGTVDEVVPQNGVAALVAPGEPPVPVDEGGFTYWIDPAPSFEVTFEGGTEPVTVGPEGVNIWNDPAFRESCTPPPPALPDAGEQPADPAAAEAEIRAAMWALYGAVGSGEVQNDLIDDPTGIAEARAEVEAGGFADDAAGAVATIAELVFTTPTEAWFRYSIDTPGADFDNRYGVAVVVDGAWKITRSTICQDLSLAGGDCGDDWQSIYPPGAFPELDEQYLGDEYRVPQTTVLE